MPLSKLAERRVSLLLLRQSSSAGVRRRGQNNQPVQPAGAEQGERAPARPRVHHRRYRMQRKRPAPHQPVQRPHVSRLGPIHAQMHSSKKPKNCSKLKKKVF